MENKTDHEKLEDSTKHLLLERFAVSGTLYISVDEKLFYSQKFGHHIKVELAFDYHVGEIKSSQQPSADSPGHEVDEVVTDPVDSFGHEVDEVVTEPVDSPGYEVNKSLTDPVDSFGHEVDEVVTDPVDSPWDEDIPINEALSMKSKSDSINSLNVKGSVKERGRMEQDSKIVYNCNEKKACSSFKTSISKKRAAGPWDRPTKNLKVKHVTDQTDKSKETVSVKIESGEDNYDPDVEDGDSCEKAFLAMEGGSVETIQKKGKGTYTRKERKTMSLSIPSESKKRIASKRSRNNLKVKLFSGQADKNKKTENLKVKFNENWSDPIEQVNDCNYQETEGKSLDSNPGTNTMYQGKAVSCLYCNESFKNQKELCHHREIDKKKQYSCPNCNKVYRYKAHFALHLISKHIEQTAKKASDYGGKPIKCEVCGTMHTNHCSLKEHLIAHTSEYSYQCCVCSQKMCLASALNDHMRKSHSTPGPVQCKVCNIRVSSRNELAKHRLVHHPLLCGLCGQVFSSRTERYVHYKTVHENDDNLLKCQQCSGLYSNKEAYESHLKYHEISKKTQCPVCGVFVSRIKKHMSISHASEQTHGEHADNTYVCDKCPKLFNNKSSFRRHLISHTGEKRHTCPECLKQFPYNSGLRYHYMSVHSQEKPYVCKICGKACSLRGNLKKHIMQVHKTDTPSKVLQCTHCGESFTQKKSLGEHVEKEHCYEGTTSILQCPQQYFQMNTSTHGQIS